MRRYPQREFSPGQLQDQIVNLASSPAHQLTMPPQQRLRAGQERAPRRFGQGLADRGKQKSITGPPASPADLTLKHTELVAQGQHFGLQLGVRLAADDQDLQQETSYGVGKSEEHDRRGSHGRPGHAEGRRLGSFRTDAVGCNGTGR